MIPTIQTLVVLLVVVAGIAAVGRRIEVPPSILLVLAGVVLALIPGLPPLELAPELVLLLVLPPLIYSSAVAMSWKEFRFNLRPIALLAVGCVVFTAGAVAAATHFILGLPWAVGFVLGTTLSYLLNRSWTFGAAERAHVIGRFTALYLATLVINVAVNAAFVRLLDGVSGRITIAWLIAQGVASTLNFVGMRYLVFPAQPASEEVPGD